jgi:hypothetical protein
MDIMDIAADVTPPAVLDIATISKADRWIDDMLPRFAAFARAHCSGRVRLHLLLLVADDVADAEAARIEARGRDLFDAVVRERFVDPEPHRRLAVFDELRAGLPTKLNLPELLYIDPDTDIVGDLQGIQTLAREADVLWVANPLPLRPVLADLERHGFGMPADAASPVVAEPGFLYLRRDLAAEFAALRIRYADVHGFAPGSTWWNMLVRSLGPKAARLPDEFNRTFWDLAAATTSARSVHYTGQWKHLRPFVEYRRERRQIVLHPRPVPLPASPPHGHAP